MTTGLQYLITLLGILTGPPEAISTPSFKQIKNACLQNSAAQKSLSGNITISTESVATNARLQSQATGTYEHLRSKGRLLFRVDLQNTITQFAHGQTAVVDQSVQTIHDGKYAYTLSTTPGQAPSATRALPKPGQTVLADDAFFASLERDYVIEVQPDEAVDSKPVWVLKASPKNRAPGRPAKTVYYLTKDSGIRIRSTSHDSTGKRIQLTELTNLKLDPPLKPERFVFKAPPGVAVVDLSESK